MQGLFIGEAAWPDPGGEAVLAGRGCGLTRVASVAEALAIWPRISPDCVFLAADLPGGLAAIPRLRGLAAGRRVPLIAVLAAPSEEVRRAVLAAGGDGCLPAPLDPAVLETCLNLLVDVAGLQARFHALLEVIPDGVLEIDDTGRILAINRAAARLFGYRPGEVLGAPVARLLPGPDPGPALGGPAGEGCRLSGRRRDGGNFPLRLVVSDCGGGAPARLLAVLHPLPEDGSG